MKKTISLILTMCTILLFTVPVAAQSSDNAMQPYGSLSLSGGLAYVTSVGSHYIHGKASGVAENKTVTVKLYKQNGNDWDYIDSVSKTGNTSTVSTGKYITITESGIYKVEVRGTTHNADGTVPYLYDVKV